MRRPALLLLAACALAGCEHLRAASRPPPARPEGADVRVYLEPLPPEADRLSFEIASISAVRPDGAAVPLEVATPVVRGAAARRQVMLASGRLPPGPYAALLVKIASASLSADGHPSSLLVPESPVRVELSFTAENRRTAFLWIGLAYRESVREGFEFAPALAARRPPPLPVPQRVSYCSNTATDELTVFDRRNREAFRAVPTGRGPRGLALDRARRRLYVAVSGATSGSILVVDSATAEKLDEIPLDPGDVPRDLALNADGTLLLSINERSNTLSFIDPLRLQRLDRIRVGEDPSSLLLDPAGVRAYVLNRRTATMSVVDVPNRMVARSVATDPDPIRAALSNDGTRLYVVHAGSPFLVLRSVPELAEVRRLYFGVGTRALVVDPRTDLVYLGIAGQPSLTVIDPLSLVEISTIEVGGEPGALAMDPIENEMFAIVPERRSVAVVDLTAHKVVGTVDVGEDPYDVVLMGGR